VEAKLAQNHSRKEIAALHFFIHEDALVDEIDLREVQKIRVSIRPYTQHVRIVGKFWHD
jgi:hypothetical protein